MTTYGLGTVWLDLCGFTSTGPIAMLFFSVTGEEEEGVSPIIV